MIKKVVPIFFTMALTMVVTLCIIGCSPTEQDKVLSQTSDIGINNSSNDYEVTNTVSITAEASERLKGMISDGDYSENVLLRIDTIKGYG